MWILSFNVFFLWHNSWKARQRLMQLKQRQKQRQNRWREKQMPGRTTRKQLWWIWYLKPSLRYINFLPSLLQFAKYVVVLNYLQKDLIPLVASLDFHEYLLNTDCRRDCCTTFTSEKGDNGVHGKGRGWSCQTDRRGARCCWENASTCTEHDRCGYFKGTCKQ